MNKKQEQRMSVIVVKDGIPKEVTGRLSSNVMDILERAYDAEKVVGISRPTYERMVEVLEYRLNTYYRTLNERQSEYPEKEDYMRVATFCEAFEIYSNESRLLFEALLWVDRCYREHETFSSRDVNCREIEENLQKYTSEVPYRAASKDFRNWARLLFRSKDLKVGLVKFCKFYLSVIQTDFHEYSIA